PARVGAERPRRHPGRDRRRRAAAGATGDPRRIPGVTRGTERGVLGRGAHRELVRVRLPEQSQAARLAAGGDGRVVDRDVAGEDLRAGGRLDAVRPDHVLEGDRDALALAVVEAEEAVELAVALVDRGAVRLEDFLA